MPPVTSRRTVVASTSWCRERTKIIRGTDAGILKVSKITAVGTILVVFVVLLQLWQILTISNGAEPTVMTVSGRPHPPAITHSASSSMDHPFPFCQLTRRCQPIHADHDRISYLHISKNSGSSWIQEFKRIKNISMDFVGGPESFPIVGLYPTKHGDYEHSHVYQESLLQKFSGPESYQRFVTLRSPRHHVWSLFSQCYYSQWGIYATLRTKFPRHHPNNVLMDFQAWLDHFVTTTGTDMTIRQERDAYDCYHPANYQSRSLSSISSENPHTVVDDIYEPNPATVNHTYWAMDWVSLTSFFHESKCILYHRIYKAGGGNNNHQPPLIQEYLERTCHCRINDMETEAHGLKDVKDTHYNSSSSSSRPVVADFPPDILQKIDILTRVDRFLYKVALQQFVEEIIWVESERQQRILCDIVLDQWGKELNYLDFNIKTAYFALRRARNLDRKVL